MNFMKKETALMFDVSKLKVGSIIMIHYSDSERYGMVDYVSPTNISIGREDGTSVSILSTDVYLDKENPVEGKVFLDVISPEEMYQIFERRSAPVKRKSGHAHNVGMNPISGKNLDIAINIMYNLAKGGNKKATLFLIDSYNGKLSAHKVYEHICREACYTIQICTDEDLKNAIRMTTLNWLDANIPLVKEPSGNNDAASMYKVIEECASEGNIVAQAFLQIYEKQDEDGCKRNDEDLSDAQHMYKIIEECANQGSKLSKMYLEIYDKQSAEECKKDDETLVKMYFKSGKDHDKAKATWIAASSFAALMQGLIDSNK